MVRYQQRQKAGVHLMEVEAALSTNTNSGHTENRRTSYSDRPRDTLVGD